MARISNKDRVLNLVDKLSTTTLGNVADLLTSIIEMASSEDLSDLETSTVSASRRKDKDSEKTEKRKPGRPKKSKDDDKPAKKAKTKKRRKDEDNDDDDDVTAFDGTPTVEDCFDFLEEFEGEPVEGGVRELSAKVKELGADPKEISDAEKRSERAADFGMFIAACDALAEKLALSEDDEIGELAEELDVEPSKRKKKTIRDIIVALNSMEDEDEDNDGDNAEDDDDDDDDDDDEDKPAKKRGRKSKKDEDDDDDLSDIDDIDD